MIDAARAPQNSRIMRMLPLILSALPVTLAAVLLRSVLPFAAWIAYSATAARLTRAKLFDVLKDDGKTYAAAAILLLLPLAQMAKVPEQLERFAYLPSAIITAAAISLFIALKVYFFPEGAAEAATKAKKAIAGFFENNSGRLAFIIAAAYFLLFSALSLAKHYAFNTRGIDLGIFDQTLWGLANGQAIFSTVVGDYLFAHHSFFLFYPLSIIYRVAPSVELLLALQIAVITLGALPLYRLAKNRLGKGLALLVVMLYLLYPALNHMSLEDFHIETFAATTILFALYFLEAGKNVLFIAAAALTALIKEDTALTAVAIGVYAIVARRKAKAGLAAVIAAGAIFAVATGAFIPHFSQGGSFRSGGFGDLGMTPADVLKSAVLHPATAAAVLLKSEKLAYLLMMTLPVGAVPLIAPEFLIGAVPAAAINLISESPQRYSVFFHYNSNIMPFIFWAFIIGLERLQKGIEKVPRVNSAKAKAAVVAALVSLALLSAYFYGPLPLAKNFGGGSYNFNSEHAKAGREIISMIPPEASVSAMNTAVPHLSQREYVYVFPNPFKKVWYLSDNRQNATIEYVLIDLLDRQREGMMNPEQFSSYANEALSSAGYGVEAYRDGWVLLKRGTEPGKLCELVRDYDRSRGTVIFLNETKRRCAAGE